MKWFQGPIPEAINKSKSEKKLFVVYVQGSNEATDLMNKVWEDKTVMELCDANKVIAVVLKAGSEEAKFFGQIYPIIVVPCSYFIGMNGVPLEVVGGHQDAATFAQSIEKAIQKLQDQIKNPSSSAASSPDSASATKDSDLDSASKEEKIKRANELRNQRREEKEKKEKEEAKRKEEERIQLGKDMQKLRQYQADRERQELEQQMKKDREEDRIAREKIKQQIAKDREERSARFRKEQEAQEKKKEEKRRQELQAKQQAAAEEQARKSEFSRIQIRLPDGSSISNKFPSSATLEEVHQYIIQTTGSDLSLSMTFPKRYFTDQDRDQTLMTLGLAPTAVLIGVHGRGRNQGTNDERPAPVSHMGFFALLLLPFQFLWNMLYRLLFGGTGPSAQASQQPPAHTSSSGPRASSSSSSSFSSSSSSSGVQRRANKTSNFQKFRNAQDDEDDDDQATWNGNSTQQM